MFNLDWVHMPIDEGKHDSRAAAKVRGSGWQRRAAEARGWRSRAVVYP